MASPGGEGGMLSVVVPVWRQWESARGLLAALRAAVAADGRGGVEIILVDNAGPDEAAGPAHLDGARILRCTAPGSYAARNAGAAAASGAWIIFTDADCLPGRDWIAAWRAAINAREGRLLAGPVRMRAADPPGAVEAYDFMRGIPQERYVARGYAATANLAVEAALFHALGGFDPARFSGGDAEFCRRAAAAGAVVRLVPGAAVSHPCRKSWAEAAAKLRREKGGQILHGTPARRAAWVVRSLLPPFGQALRFARADAPTRTRALAVGVAGALWLVGIAEMVRLALGGRPERL
jgi:GT2 family glycosyltransferase